MRIAFSSIVMAFVVTSCTTNEPTDVIEGYHVDFEPTVDKTCLYVCVQTTDTMMSTYKGFTDGTGSYVVTDFYREQNIFSRRKYKVEAGKKFLVEEKNYRDYYGDPVPDGVNSEIREQSNFREDLKYSGARFTTAVSYPADNMQKAINEEWYEKDTVFQWQGELVPAIKFRGYDRYSYFNKYLPFASTVNEYDSYTIVAKGLGTVAWGYRMREGSYVEDVVLVRVQENLK